MTRHTLRIDSYGYATQQMGIRMVRPVSLECKYALFKINDEIKIGLDSKGAKVHGMFTLQGVILGFMYVENQWHLYIMGHSTYVDLEHILTIHHAKEIKQ